MTETQRAIDAIRAKYPKHSKAAYSLASRPKETGVTFAPGAKKIDAEARGIAKRKDTHRLQDRVTCRVTPEVFAKIKAAVEQSEERTVDAWLNAVLAAELEKECEK